MRATLSAPRLVRVNTSTRVNSGLANSSVSRPRLRPASTNTTCWLTRSTVVAGGATETFSGSLFSSSPASLLDVRRHGGREEQVLALLRQVFHDLADRHDEAHVEHLVGFVEDEDLDLREVGVTLAKVVEQAAGSGDDDVDAARQRLALRAMADAAEDGGDAEAELGAVGLEAFGDLRREFARRRQDERTAAAARRRLTVGREAVEDGEGEGGGLAGAGLGDAEQVAAFHHAGNGGELDRRGLGIALLGQRLEDRGVEVQGP